MIPGEKGYRASVLRKILDALFEPGPDSVMVFAHANGFDVRSGVYRDS